MGRIDVDSDAYDRVRQTLTQAAQSLSSAGGTLGSAVPSMAFGPIAAFIPIEDMRTYQANRARGHEAAGEQRDLLLRHAERVELEIAVLRVHRDYLERKAALWDARERGDVAAESEAQARVAEITPRLEAMIHA